MAHLGRGHPLRPALRTAPRSSRGGTVTITAALTLTVTGTKHAGGTVTITAAVALTPSGTKHASGTATIAAALTLQVTGTKETGIGLPPRPRLRWQLVLGPASGGHELALTEATDRKYTAKLDEPAELSFTIDGRHPQAAAIAELSTDVHVLWTSDAGETRILDRCRVGSTQDTITDKEHTLTVGCLDYKAVLLRRRLYSTDTLTFTAMDQAEIAWALIATTQAHTGGALGISKGWTGTSPTGITRDRTYEAGDSVGERITELGEVIDGFDWDITPVSPSGLRFDVWYPQRGVDRGVILIHGGPVSSASREVNPADYANALRFTGAAGDDVTPGPTPVEVEADGLADMLQGRWDAAHGDDGLITQAALDQRAAWQLDQSQVVRPVWTVALRRGAWAGPDHIWVGDPVRLVVQSGRLNVNAVYRVYEVEISLDGDGGESVSLALGGPRPDFRRRASAVERRLAALERR
jgi:hypothetical protein